MKVAAAAYPLDVLPNWQTYEDKLSSWVSEAAGNGAELLVFPEYGAMELATLAGLGIAGDLEGSLHAVAERLDRADAIHTVLAREHNLHILAASGPAFGHPRPVNRARLITPDGAIGIQDKQIMTRFEREEWDVAAGGPLQLFETDLGRIGVLICYDCEFPLLGARSRMQICCWSRPAPKPWPGIGGCGSEPWRGRWKTNASASCRPLWARPTGHTPWT